MGIFDKAKDMAGDVDLGDMVDKAQDVVEEHGDKLPGGMGDKIVDGLEKVEDLVDKLPGQGD